MKPEFESYYKFLISIGLILVLAPSLAIGYIIVNCQNLLVTVPDMSSITPASQNLYYLRETLLGIPKEILLMLIIALIGIGLFLIARGLKQWKPLQEISNEKLYIEKEAAKRGLAKATPYEIEGKINREMASDVSTTQEELKTIERKTLDYIAERLPKRYELLRGIRIRSTICDAIAATNNGKDEIIIEVKQLKHIPDSSYLNRINQLAYSQKEAYRSIMGHDANFMLALVIPDSIYSSIKKKFDELMVDYNTINKIEAIPFSVLDPIAPKMRDQ